MKMVYPEITLWKVGVSLEYDKRTVFTMVGSLSWKQEEAVDFECGG